MSLSGLAVAAAPAQAAQPAASLSVAQQGGQFYGGPIAVGSAVTVNLTNYPLAQDASTPNVRVEYCGFSIANFRATVTVCDAASTVDVAVWPDNGNGDTSPVGSTTVPVTVSAGFTTGTTTVNCLVGTCGFRTSSITAVSPDPAAKTGGYVTLGTNPSMTVTLANGDPIPAAGIKYTDGFTKLKVTGKNFRPGTRMRLLQCDLVFGSSKCFGVATDGNGYVDTPAADLAGSWTTEIGVANKLVKSGVTTFNCFVVGTECGLMTSRFDAGGDRGQETSVPFKFAPPATTLSVNPQGGEFYGGPVAVGQDVTVSLTNYPVAANPANPNVKVEYCGFSIANFRATVTACSTDPASVKTVAVVSPENATFSDATATLKASAGFTTGSVTVDCLAGTCGFRTSAVTPVNPDPMAKTGAYITLGTNPSMTVTLANGDAIPAAGIPYTNGFAKLKVTGKNFRPGTQMRLLECDLNFGSAKCYGVATDGNGYVDTPAADQSGTWTAEIGVSNLNVKNDNVIFNCFTQGTRCGLMTSRFDAGGDRGQETSVEFKWAPPAKPRIDVTPQGGQFYGGPLTGGSDIDVTVSNLPLAADPAVANVKVEYCGFVWTGFSPSVKACSTDPDSMATIAVTAPNSTGVMGNATVTLKAAETFTTGEVTVDCLVDTCGFRSSGAAGANAAVNASGGYVTLGTNPSMTVSLPNGDPIPAAGLPYSEGFTTIKVEGKNFRPGKKMRLLECDLDFGSSKCFGVATDGNGYVDTPAADEDGSWTTEINVAHSNVKDGTTVFDCLVDGANCGLMTSRYDAGADRGQESSVSVKFAPKAPAPPVVTPTLTLSKSKLRVGDTVTLTGKNFPKTAKSLYVTICADPPSATNCDMTLTNIGQIAYNGSGGFTTTYQVKTSKFTAGDGVIDCTKVQCVIGTTNAVQPADRSYNATAKFTVDTSPVAKAPTKAKVGKVTVKKNGTVVVKWAKSKAQGSPITGYVVQLKKGSKAWKNAGTVSASTSKVKLTKVKPGKYKVRVITTSAAGNTTSNVVKFKIKK